MGMLVELLKSAGVPPQRAMFVVASTTMLSFGFIGGISYYKANQFLSTVQQINVVQAQQTKNSAILIEMMDALSRKYENDFCTLMELIPEVTKTPINEPLVKKLKDEIEKTMHLLPHHAIKVDSIPRSIIYVTPKKK